MEINKFSVVGAGTMGHAIAELAAIAGYDVWLNDVSEEILNRARERIKWSLEKLREKGKVREVEEVLSRIRTTTDQEKALRDSDFVIEAIIEDVEAKKKLFSKADSLISKEGVLASNTSSIPITEIAQATKRPERVIGMHFFNPPVLMPSVEVIMGKSTSQETLEKALVVSNRMGKEPIIVKKDVVGFIVNRILYRVYDIACWLADNGFSIEDIDATAIHELGFPMGVFILRDYAGLDVEENVMKIMVERGFELYSCREFNRRVRAREFGVKSGKGFYSYPEPGKYVKPSIPKERAGKVKGISLISPAINETAMFLREGITTPEDVGKACRLGLGWPKSTLDYLKEYGVREVVEELRRLKDLTKLNHYEPDKYLVEMVR